MILGGRSCPTPSRTASTSRNPSAAVLSELVHDRRDRARRGSLMVLQLRSFWRLACGDCAAPGSLPLIPPDGETHALHIADASPQTHKPIDVTAHAPCRTRSRLARSIRAAQMDHAKTPPRSGLVTRIGGEERPLTDRRGGSVRACVS